jgi:mannose/fructose/N-acetylgalactosamine-specific phosphotransferase system component IID
MKSRSSNQTKRNITEQGVTTIFGKRILAASVAFALVVCGAFAVSAVTTNSVVYNVSAGTTATENISEMIEDLVPSFVLLVFVMVFMLMLLTIVDRIGKK